MSNHYKGTFSITEESCFSSDKEVGDRTSFINGDVEQLIKPVFLFYEMNIISLPFHQQIIYYLFLFILFGIK